MKLFRLRRLNAADQASDLQSPVQRADRPEQREQPRHRLFNLRRSRNLVGREREDQARSPVPAKLSPGKSRRSSATEYHSANDSARPRLPARVNRSRVAEVRRPEFVNRSRHLLVAHLRVKHALEEKELRAHMANRLRRQPVEGAKHAAKDNEYRPRKVSGSSNRAAARLAQPSAARDKASRKVERSEHQKKRHRQGNNNFGAITPAAPEQKTPEPLFLCAEL